MKLTVEKSDLTEAVAWAVRSVPSRPTMPVLAGVLLDATSDGLGVAGFDFEVATRGIVDAAVSEGGRVLVSGRLLADIARALPAAPVELSTEGSRVVVRCGQSRFELPTLPVEDYPELPDLPETSGRIPASVFTTAVTQVAVAAGRDDTLPVLTGVRLEIDGERLTLAATDRYRLAVRELVWKPEGGGAELPPSALVPARTLADTARTLTSGDGDVIIAFAEGQPGGPGGGGLAGFAAGRRVTTTRLLDGEFPGYRKLLPTSTEATAELDTSELIDAVKRVSLVLSRTAPVRLSFEGEEVVLDAGGGDEAQARERLPVRFDGPAMTIAFNPGYLLDGLAVLDSPTARFAFTTPAKPVVITGVGDYRYLLMPVRLSD